MILSIIFIIAAGLVTLIAILSRLHILPYPLFEASTIGFLLFANVLLLFAIALALLEKEKQKMN
ncbi:MAG: hypothetical protein AB1393_05530 [Candidatus Edwardsbacteria bacterium]